MKRYLYPVPQNVADVFFVVWEKLDLLRVQARSRYKVKIEAKIGDYYTDLLLLGDDSKRWAFEFALSPEYQVHNIKKLLRFDLNGITVVSDSTTVLAAINGKARKELNSRELKKIRFVSVKDLLKPKKS